MPYGIVQTDWDAAKAEVKGVLIARAKVRGMIPYSALVEQVRAVQFRAHDDRLFSLLEAVSREEDQAGRGLLSVLVVHKNGDMQPGPGFFELASALGRDTSDILRCWIKEMKKVHAYWERA